MALAVIRPDKPNSLGSSLADGDPLVSSNLSPDTRSAIEQELEAICNDAKFRASERNCAFLRYVITETLAGRSGEIKERILGKELFGRPISYDTGSDAVVRVRANEVRKRLSVYYESHPCQAGWKIHLPLRTYVPVFVPVKPEEAPLDAVTDSGSLTDLTPLPGNGPDVVLPSSAPALAVEQSLGSNAFKVPEIPMPPVRILPASHMVLPTLIALFLCAATFRWQALSGNPYVDFWETLLTGHAGIALILDADQADRRAVTVSDLELIRPLLVTAAAFHAPAWIGSAGAAESGDENMLPVRVTHHAPPDTQDGAGYITLVPSTAQRTGRSASLWVGSGNNDQLELAIRSMTDSDLFPTPLELAARRSTPTRLRFVEGKPVVAQSVAFAEGSPRQ